MSGQSAQLEAVQRLFTDVTGFAEGFSATVEAPPIFEPQSRSAYYSVIARAVSSLPRNTRAARQALYDRAGVALAASLLDKEGQFSDSQIAVERLALQRAIRKVEGEAQKKEQPIRKTSAGTPIFSTFLRVFSR